MSTSDELYNTSLKYLSKSLDKLTNNKPINLRLINEINKKYMLVSPNVLSYYPVKYHTYDREQVNELRETIIEIIRKLKQYKYQYINQVPPTGTTVPPVSPRRVPQPYSNNNTQPPRSSMGLPASPVSPRRVPQPYSNNFNTQPPRSSMGLPTTGSPPRQPSGLPASPVPPPRRPSGLPASVPMTFTDQQLRNIFQGLTDDDVVQFQNEWNTITNFNTKNLIYETIMKLEPDTPLIFTDPTDASDYILSNDTTRKILKIFNVTTINNLRNITSIRTYLARNYSAHFTPPSILGVNSKCNSEHICSLMNNLLMTIVYEYTEALLQLP